MNWWIKQNISKRLQIWLFLMILPLGNSLPGFSYQESESENDTSVPIHQSEVSGEDFNAFLDEGQENGVQNPRIMLEMQQPLSNKLIKEIASYKGIVNRIIMEVLNGSFKGRTYNDVATFVDTFGPRLSGSQALEDSIDYMLEKMKKMGLENVHGEEVMIPHWVRGQECGEMILPWKKKLAVHGLGGTIGTPSGGIQAEVVAVSTLDEVLSRGKDMHGKIVAFIVKKGTGKIVAVAAKLGAVAALSSLQVPISIYTPHMWSKTYGSNETKIPVVSIPIEDIEMFQRMCNRGVKVVINLYIEAKSLPKRKSRNAIGEIKGFGTSDEYVIVSGHIDSWDLGVGAMDDAAGFTIGIEALAILKHFKLRPRRTLRAILWTAEELGLIGAQAYIVKHANELEKIVAIFESDHGTFRPRGIGFSGSLKAGLIVQEILKLLKPINTTLFKIPADGSTDIIKFTNKGIPSLTLKTEMGRYFYFHHTEGDTMRVEKPENLDLCTVVWTVVSYIIADLSERLPR